MMAFNCGKMLKTFELMGYFQNQIGFLIYIVLGFECSTCGLVRVEDICLTSNPKILDSNLSTQNRAPESGILQSEM